MIAWGPRSDDSDARLRRPSSPPIHWHEHARDTAYPSSAIRSPGPPSEAVMEAALRAVGSPDPDRALGAQAAPAARTRSRSSGRGFRRRADRRTAQGAGRRPGRCPLRPGEDQRRGERAAGRQGRAPRPQQRPAGHARGARGDPAAGPGQLAAPGGDPGCRWRRPGSGCCAPGLRIPAHRGLQPASASRLKRWSPISHEARGTLSCGRCPGMRRSWSRSSPGSR